MASISSHNSIYSSINNVHKLHFPINGPYDNLVCNHCTDLMRMYRPNAPEDVFQEYPCPTIETLNRD